MGTFSIRNALEALVCVVPIVFLVMMLPVFAMLTRLMIALVLAVPIGGFTLLGVHDESMLQFFRHGFNGAGTAANYFIEVRYGFKAIVIWAAQSFCIHACTGVRQYRRMVAGG